MLPLKRLVFRNPDMHMAGDIDTRGMLAPVLQTSQDNALDMIDCRCLCDKPPCDRPGRDPWTPVCKGCLVSKNIPGLGRALECDRHFDHRAETPSSVLRKS
jgi:hypothetical protein